jgi:hypothetical protein
MLILVLPVAFQTQCRACSCHDALFIVQQAVLVNKRAFCAACCHGCCAPPQKLWRPAATTKRYSVN